MIHLLRAPPQVFLDRYFLSSDIFRPVLIPRRTGRARGDVSHRMWPVLVDLESSSVDCANVFQVITAKSFIVPAHVE